MENAKPKLKIVPRMRDHDELEKEQKQWRITREEAGRRVAALRAELESNRDQVEAVPFDIPSGEACEPACLDGISRKHTVELVAALNPTIDGFFSRCDEVAKQCGAREVIDDYNSQLFNLKMCTAETGYQIGVLAGVIFSGASKETVDRFERGLLFALCSNRWIVKDEEKGEGNA